MTYFYVDKKTGVYGNLKDLALVNTQNLGPNDYDTLENGSDTDIINIGIAKDEQLIYNPRINPNAFIAWKMGYEEGMTDGIWEASQDNYNSDTGPEHPYDLPG